MYSPHRPSLRHLNVVVFPSPYLLTEPGRCCIHLTVPLYGAWPLLYPLTVPLYGAWPLLYSPHRPSLRRLAVVVFPSPVPLYGVWPLLYSPHRPSLRRLAVVVFPSPVPLYGAWPLLSANLPHLNLINADIPRFLPKLLEN